MTIDPQDPDWAALAPICELGPLGRVPGGVRCATEDGPLASDLLCQGCHPPDARRRRRDRYGILMSAADAPAVQVDRGADGFVLCAGGLRLAQQADPLRLSLERAGQASSTDAHFRRPHRLPPFARTADGWLADARARERRGDLWPGRAMGPVEPARPAAALRGSRTRSRSRTTRSICSCSRLTAPRQFSSATPGSPAARPRRRAGASAPGSPRRTTGTPRSCSARQRACASAGFRPTSSPSTAAPGRTPPPASPSSSTRRAIPRPKR